MTVSPSPTMAWFKVSMTFTRSSGWTISKNTSCGTVLPASMPSIRDRPSDSSISFPEAFQTQ